MVWVYNRNPEPVNQAPVPAIAYVFIGLTSLVLAYFTAVDKNTGGATEVVAENKEESATSMLPSFSNTPEESQYESKEQPSYETPNEEAEAVPAEDSPEKSITGGKKKNKKTKRRKQKQNRSVRLSK